MAVQGATPQTQTQTNGDIRTDLTEWKSEISAIAPQDLSIDVFLNTVFNATKLNPDLLTADRDTLKNAVLKCAKRGLFPDGEEAFLQVRKINVNASKKDELGNKLPDLYIPQVFFSIMRKGVEKILIKYGGVSKIVSNCVYEKDDFEFLSGEEEGIRHKICRTEPGQFQLVYAILKFKDGREAHRDYMRKSEIDAAMKASPFQATWQTWYGENAKKTLLKRMYKHLDAKLSIYDDEDIEMIETLKAQDKTPKLETPIRQMEKAVLTPNEAVGDKETPTEQMNKVTPPKTPLPPLQSGANGVALQSGANGVALQSGANNDDDTDNEDIF